MNKIAKLTKEILNTYKNENLANKLMYLSRSHGYRIRLLTEEEFAILAEKYGTLGYAGGDWFHCGSRQMVFQIRNDGQPICFTL